MCPGRRQSVFGGFLLDGGGSKVTNRRRVRRSSVGDEKATILWFNYCILKAKIFIILGVHSVQ